jgi:alpha-glucosidase
MNYRKVETPENYNFITTADGSAEGVRLGLGHASEGTYRLRGSSSRWPDGSGSLAGLDAASFEVHGGPETARCTLSADGRLDLALDGTQLLNGAGFGVCGAKWMLRFKFDEETRFYGMGGKNLGFELSGKRTIFWNTDLFAEFEWSAVEESRADPLYSSFPVLIGRAGPSLWWAIVMDAPWPAFINIGAVEGIFAAGSTPFDRYLYMGAQGGSPDLWIMADREPANLVRKIQSLQGRMNLPPLWALGKHQSRWGYRSSEDLNRIADGYEKRSIPLDGLWLDIDYMDGFRVFTMDSKHFDDPAARLSELNKRGYRVVPILDPGLKRDPEYKAYAKAKKQGVLCQTGEGQDYTGFVWPGYAVFPDFSMEEGRAFWADQVETLTRLGFSGYWIDMNDPAAGSSPLDDMRFSHGRKPHDAFHNQYALGMAIATRAGLEEARPGLRQFMVSRSAYLGMSRYSGMWTGDNVSNDHHLAASVAFSLNLSVSGMPLQGPDVPGFSGNADAPLMEAWYKAGFLFPFFRNHSAAGTSEQEPWTRGKTTERIVTDFIRSRYKLIPYVYQSWISQEERGDPVMRPLWYAWPGEEWTLECGDQFMLGDAVMHAPILDSKAGSRKLRLPACRWFDWNAGRFIEGGAQLDSSPGRGRTPLYFRSGFCVPMQRGIIKTNRKDLRRVDLVLFAEPGSSGIAHYAADDGETLEYRKGKRSVMELDYHAEGETLVIESKRLQSGYGAIRFRVLVPEISGVCCLKLDGREVSLKRELLGLAGRRHAFLAGASVVARNL